MKQIVIGQLMLWGNVLTTLLGYMLISQFQLPEFVSGLIGFIGICSAVLNIIFSVFLQINGYRKLGVFEGIEL